MRALAAAVLAAVLPWAASAHGSEQPADAAPRVAVLDSGLFAGWQSHPEFVGADVVAWRDFVGDAVTPVDPLGHGTAVASLVAGATLGVAPEAALIVGRIIGTGGLDSWATLVAGIDWAVAEHADVINVSLWSALPDLEAGREVADAIARARRAGVLTVWIAGNGWEAPGSPAPATALVGSSAPQALVVGSADAGGRPSAWSRPDPELLAWGEDVTAAGPSLDVPLITGLSGTSYAAPRVAGVAAALIAHGAPRDPDWLEWVLLHAAADDPHVSYLDEGYGFFGEASLSEAIAVARGERPVPGIDARDAFHLAAAGARSAVTASPPAGAFPP